MDSFTHIALGACIGEALAGKYLGKKAMVLGIIGQSIPDIDFISGIWLKGIDQIMAHRAFTHSILFAVVVTLLLSWVSARVLHLHNLRLRKYILLFSVNIFVHIFIDTFNAYGTALLSPFSNTRFSFNTLFVADPLFSAGPFVAAIWLLFSKQRSVKNVVVALTGIALSTLYIGYAVYNKTIADRALKHTLTEKHITSLGYISTPTLFNSWLWFVVVRQQQGYQVGYRSVFDKQKNVPLHYIARNDSLLLQAPDQQVVQDLLKFSNNYYSVEKWHDTLTMNILRFGQIGWQDSSTRFAFYYFLNQPDGNLLVTQRGRFKEMDSQNISRFIRRIQGK